MDNDSADWRGALTEQERKSVIASLIAVIKPLLVSHDDASLRLMAMRVEKQVFDRASSRPQYIATLKHYIHSFHARSVAKPSTPNPSRQSPFLDTQVPAPAQPSQPVTTQVKMTPVQLSNEHKAIVISNLHAMQHLMRTFDLVLARVQASGLCQVLGKLVLLKQMYQQQIEALPQGVFYLTSETSRLLLEHIKKSVDSIQTPNAAQTGVRPPPQNGISVSSPALSNSAMPNSGLLGNAALLMSPPLTQTQLMQHMQAIQQQQQQQALSNTSIDTKPVDVKRESQPSDLPKSIDTIPSAPGIESSWENMFNFDFDNIEASEKAVRPPSKDSPSSTASNEPSNLLNTSQHGSSQPPVIDQTLNFADPSQFLVHTPSMINPALQNTAINGMAMSPAMNPQALSNGAFSLGSLTPQQLQQIRLRQMQQLQLQMLHQQQFQQLQQQQLQQQLQQQTQGQVSPQVSAQTAQALAAQQQAAVALQMHQIRQMQNQMAGIPAAQLMNSPNFLTTGKIPAVSNIQAHALANLSGFIPAPGQQPGNRGTPDLNLLQSGNLEALANMTPNIAPTNSKPAQEEVNTTNTWENDLQNLLEQSLAPSEANDKKTKPLKINSAGHNPSENGNTLSTALFEGLADLEDQPQENSGEAGNGVDDFSFYFDLDSPDSSPKEKRSRDSEEPPECTKKRRHEVS